MAYRSLQMSAEGIDSEDVPSWRDEALCRGFDIAVFFPDESDAGAIAHAKDVCSSCPVQQDCLSYAVEHNQTDGIWGGTTRQERRRLRRIWVRDMREAG